MDVRQIDGRDDVEVSIRVLPYNPTISTPRYAAALSSADNAFTRRNSGSTKHSNSQRSVARRNGVTERRDGKGANAQW